MATTKTDAAKAAESIIETVRELRQAELVAAGKFIVNRLDVVIGAIREDHISKDDIVPFVEDLREALAECVGYDAEEFDVIIDDDEPFTD